MKARWPATALLLFLLLPLDGAAETVFRRVPSRALGGDAAVSLLLPPSYGASPGTRYPVLYFLHDALGNEKTLLARGVAEQLEASMRAGSMPEMIVVAPRGSGSWYIDSFDGRQRYSSFLDEELVPWVDAGYRTLPVRASRAVAGISMGGYGALRWALRDPGRFSWVGGLSPAVLQLTSRAVSELQFFQRLSLTKVFGKDERTNVLRANDLYQLLLDDPSLAGRLPPISLRAGLDDEYHIDMLSVYLSKYLSAMGATASLTLEQGTHDWGYWKVSLPVLLKDLPF